MYQPATDVNGAGYLTAPAESGRENVSIGTAETALIRKLNRSSDRRAVDHREPAAERGLRAVQEVESGIGARALLRRMLAEHEDVFFYLTLMNENYAQPAIPDGAQEGIRRGMHLVKADCGFATGSGLLARRPSVETSRLKVVTSTGRPARTADRHQVWTRSG